MDTRPKFAVDEMLGSLVRWLRMMGYDATYMRDRRDGQILEAARKEGRFLLTRDWELAQRSGDRGLYVESDKVEEQLHQVVEKFGLEPNEERPRCSSCNGELKKVPKEEVFGKVPDVTYQSNQEFFLCGSCGKIYWKGSHWNHIRTTFQRLKG